MPRAEVWGEILRIDRSLVNPSEKNEPKKALTGRAE